MTRNRKPGQQFWQYVRNYLTVHLPRIRCLSPRTVDTYRQSIAMYCSFLKDQSRVEFSKVSFEHVTRDSVLKFIQWLREKRSCGVSTCNLRLSSLKSFLKFCADWEMSLYSVYLDVKRIPLMKGPKISVEYMSETALEALLAQPDTKTTKGSRNSMSMILLYDTATRVQELVDIKAADLHLEARTPFVTITGKGNKTRILPLMDKTVAHLKEYLRRFHTASVDPTGNPLFYSIRSGMPHKLSTDTISVMLRKYGKSAQGACPEVPERVYPHLIRHTRAMHLYQSGMPLSYIADFLGHVNTSTTEIYASASLEMLREALEKADPELSVELPRWKDEESLKKLCGLL